MENGHWQERMSKPPKYGKETNIMIGYLKVANDVESGEIHKKTVGIALSIGKDVENIERQKKKLTHCVSMVLEETASQLHRTHSQQEEHGTKYAENPEYIWPNIPSKIKCKIPSFQVKTTKDIHHALQEVLKKVFLGKK